MCRVPPSRSDEFVEKVRVRHAVNAVSAEPSRVPVDAGYATDGRPAVRHGGEYVKRKMAVSSEQVRGRLKRRAKELGFEVVKAAEGAAGEGPVSVPPDPPASE